jgi:sulfatase maturation enzyme AslB (radical SAM superfamily)
MPTSVRCNTDSKSCSEFQKITKILVLGNNSQDTDDLVSALADAAGTVNYGLVTDPLFCPDSVGYYHTSVTDIAQGSIVMLAKKFDQVIMLDQPKEIWSHWKCLLGTYKVMCHLEDAGINTVFRHNNNVKKFQYWQQLQQENKSFCLYPWINKHSKRGSLRTCARSSVPLTPIADLTSWRDDPGLNEVRNKMLQGEKLHEHCKTCYDYEDKNIESYRQFETLDWIAMLDLESVEDLKSIDQPYYYELHTGNTCNIKCRGCSPKWSNQIDKEFKKFNIVTPDDMPGHSSTLTTASIDEIDISKLTNKHRVYFQGGEPTIMPEVTEFMKECVRQNVTDFELAMCTNGLVLPEEFLDLTRHFSMMNFSFSIDGYEKINDYWRWGSKWNKVIANAHRIQEMGHYLSINTVPGIYNVTNLHQLFEFLDQEFPTTSVYLQINYVDIQSAYNHPRPDLVVASMEKCKKTSTYFSNAKSCRTGIDSLYDYYLKNPQCDIDKLQKFFEFNDQLDRVRGSKLGDYIPELEACRKFIE